MRAVWDWLSILFQLLLLSFVKSSKNAIWIWELDDILNCFYLSSELIFSLRTLRLPRILLYSIFGSWSNWPLHKEKLCNEWMNARMMSKSTHSNWKKKPLKKLTCLHFEPGPQTSGLVGSSAIFNGAKVFIATTLRGVGTGRGGPPRFWQEYQQHLFLPKVFCLILLLVQKCLTILKFFFTVNMAIY